MDQKTVLLKVALHKFVHLKFFWTQFKNMHLRGPCSLRLCISRPYCIILSMCLFSTVVLTSNAVPILVRLLVSTMLIVLNCKEFIKIDFSGWKIVMHCFWKVHHNNSNFLKSIISGFTILGLIAYSNW